MQRRPSDPPTSPIHDRCDAHTLQEVAPELTARTAVCPCKTCVAEAQSNPKPSELADGVQAPLRRNLCSSRLHASMSILCCQEHQISAASKTRSTGHKPYLHGALQRVLCFRQGLFQGFLREADCGVLVYFPSPVRPPSPSKKKSHHRSFLSHMKRYVM